MKIQYDAADILLEIVGYPAKNHRIPRTEINDQFHLVYKLMKEIGIDTSVIKADLIIWNDTENTTDSVVDALIQVCHIDSDNSHHIMWEAHTKGKSVAKEGTVRHIFPMVKKLKERGITATIDLKPN